MRSERREERGERRDVVDVNLDVILYCVVLCWRESWDLGVGRFVGRNRDRRRE